MRKVRPALLKGFDQEFLPHEQLQFNALVDLIRRNFERFGFLPIETPSAERIEVLTSKGGAEKEIYALSRLAAEDDDEAAAKGALRFDLTVPLARYVAMRERELAFPFRRYQIQRVWRGENPQVKRGRFREFYQCDIDIIGRETLSYLAEAEIPSVIHAVFQEMAIGEFRIRINNRKVLKGILRHFDVPEAEAATVLRSLDKIDREDERTIQEELKRQGMSAKSAAELYRGIASRRETKETLALVAALGCGNEMETEGMGELGTLQRLEPLLGAAEGGQSAATDREDPRRGTRHHPGSGLARALLAHRREPAGPGHQYRGLPRARENRQTVRVRQQERLPHRPHRRTGGVHARYSEGQGPRRASRNGGRAGPGHCARKRYAHFKGSLMALDLEEQEQLAELKAWWNQYGSLIVAAITAAAVTFAGWQAWRWYERSQAAQAGALFDTPSRAAQAGDAEALRDADGALVENYPRTLYAAIGGA